MHTFIPTFFVGRYHTTCLSTDEWFFVFPVILVAQVLVGAMGNTPPIWVHEVGDISVVILSWWILYICVWGPDRDFSPPLRDYTPSSIRFLCSRLHSSLNNLLFASQHKEFTISFFIFLSSSSFRRAQCITLQNAGEGRVNAWITLLVTIDSHGLVYDPRRNGFVSPTFTSFDNYTPSMLWWSTSELLDCSQSNNTEFWNVLWVQYYHRHTTSTPQPSPRPHSSPSHTLRSFGFLSVWPGLVSPWWPLYVLPVQPSVWSEEFRSSVLAFSLSLIESLYRHPSICILFSSHFTT